MFKFFLNFIDLPQFGKIEIDEPFGFDGATHEIKNESGHHSRNVIIANQDIKFEFTRDNHLNAFELLKNQLKIKGWELNVEFILERDNVEFTTGILDGLTATKYRDSIEFNIIQNTLFDFIKKNENVKIDAFSDTDLEGNNITPCQTQNIFLKAKPILRQSKWSEKSAQNIAGSLIGNYFSMSSVIPIANNLIQYEINSTFAPFDIDFTIADNITEERTKRIANRFIRVNETLTEVKISLKNLRIKGQAGAGLSQNPRISVTIVTPNIDLNGFADTPETFILWENQNFYSPFDIQQDFELNIPSISAGKIVLIEFVFFGSFANLGGFVWGVDIYSIDEVTISATSTAISTVVKGVKLHDLLKHQSDSMGAAFEDNVFLSDDYINNFVLNGRMLANLDDLPFNNTFKQTFESFSIESGSDWQVTENTIETNLFSDYYKDIEIAQFDELPDSNGEIMANSDLAINIIEIVFKKSSDERTNNRDNTSDDVHTNLQARFDSRKADAIWKREMNHIRSAYLIEEQRRKGNIIEERSKSLENDENLFCLDCVPIAPNTQNTISVFVSFRRFALNNNGMLELLSNGSFRWTNIGVVVGQNIIVNGLNHQVTAIEDFKITMIQLQPPFTAGVGEGSFTLVYSLQGVAFTNRTNEGFDVINGIRDPEDYSNLKFTLKRILNKWSKWLATAGQYLINKNINITEIKVNNQLDTKLIDEVNNIVDFDPINLDVDYLENRILNGNTHNLRVYADFEKATQLFKDVRDVKGYIRVNTLNEKVIKGFVKDLNYNWRSQELVFNLLERKDNLINELAEIVENINNFNTINDFVYIYDYNNNLLFTPIQFNYFSINGIIYENVDLFNENFINLLND